MSMKKYYVFAILATACCGCEGLDNEGLSQGLDQGDLANESLSSEEVGSVADPLASDKVVCGEVPQTTLNFRQEQKKAVQESWATYKVCTDVHQQHLLDCIASGDSEEKCIALKADEARICSFNRYKQLNAPSEERCGAQVWEILSDTKPEDFKDPQFSNIDTDGDGLTDSVEVYYLGSDPCKDYSLDPCVPDAKVDSDGDGIPNGKDPAPSCFGTDVTACYP